MSASLTRPLSCPRNANESGKNRFLPEYGPSLVDSVLQAIQSATVNAELEFFAAVKIQATFRMHKARAQFVHIRAGIVHIQSVYRGYAQRLRTQAHRAHVEKQRLMAVFHAYATAIQACFRGFYSRKHRDNFYKRKRYLVEVTNRSNDVLLLSEEVNGELNTLVRLREVTAEQTAYMKATEKVHYLLSTATSRGVYNPPATLLLSGPAVETMGTATTTSWQEGTMDWAGGGSGAGGDDGRPLSQQQQPRMPSPPGLSPGTRTVFQTGVEDDIRTNATAARHPAIRKALAANATTKIVTGSAAVLFPPPSSSLSATAAAATADGPQASSMTRPLPGDGVGGGGDVSAVDGGLTIGGVPEREIRKERQARRELYGRSVRASHYPASPAGAGPPPGDETVRDDSAHSEVAVVDDATLGNCFAASAPARTGGVTVASRSIGVGAEAGVLPPIRPKRREPQATLPLSTAVEAFSSQRRYPYRTGKDGSTTRGDAGASRSAAMGDDSYDVNSQQQEEEEGTLASSSALPVPWQNADSVPRQRQHVSSTNLEAGAKTQKKSKAAAGVSSRNKAFHIPAHDCRDHIGSSQPVAFSVSAGGGAALSTTAAATRPQATEGFASTSVERPHLLLSEKPLYDTDKASLQRAVDAQVRKALHGNATFKV